jgi:hypothetical protein
MIEALIAGRRTPRALAGLAIGKARAKRAGLAVALEGRREEHHGIRARILLGNIGAAARQIGQLTGTTGELISQVRAAWGIDADGTAGPHAGTSPDSPVLPAIAQLDAITGCGIIAAQAVIAGTGLDMTVSGTPGRLVSRARRCPQTRQLREEDQRRHGRQGQPLARRHPRRDRRLRRPHRPVGGRARPAARPPPRQAQSHGRHRRLHPGHHLACYRTGQPGSAISARTSTTPRSTAAARSAAASASSRWRASPGISPGDLAALLAKNPPAA